jgi:hypothetical protein
LLNSAYASAQSVTLAWDANTEPQVAGYRVYYGTSSGSYTQNIDAGNNTTATVSGLDVSQDYYFAVRAYDNTGGMSPFSAEVNQPAIVAPGTTTISSFTANRVSPFLSGNPVRWTAVATSKKGAVEYKFLMYSASTGWTVIQDFSQVATLDWTPGFEDVGAHTIQVWARTVGSPAAYEAWVGTNFDVASTPLRLSADVDFPAPPGQPINWTATVAGSNGTLEYRFLIQNRATSVWSEIRAYGTSNQATWTPAATGTYYMQVWARRVGSTAAYQVWGGSDVLTVSRTPLTVTSLTADVPLPSSTGSPITWTVRSKGGTSGPIEYAFYRFSLVTNTWQLVRAYSSSKTYTWTPAWGEQGQYTMQVWARNAGSTAAYDAWTGTNYFVITQPPVQLSSNTVFPVPPGTAVTWTASVAGSAANLEYAFYVYTQSTGTWTNARAYSSSNTFAWTPTRADTYLLQVWVRRVGSTAAYDLWNGTDYLRVAPTPAQIASLTSDISLPASVGTPITWTAVASGGTARPLQYRFYLYSEGAGWTMLRDYSTSNTITWTPGATDTGGHVVQVWVRSAGSTTATYEGWMGTTMFLITP